MKKYEVTLSSPGGAISYIVEACDSDRAIIRARKLLREDVGERNARKFKCSIIEETEKDDKNG